MMVTTDPGVTQYLSSVLQQMSGAHWTWPWQSHTRILLLIRGRTCLPLRAGWSADWLLDGQLQKMVLVVTSIASKEVLERWTFDIQTDKAAVSGGRAPLLTCAGTVNTPSQYRLRAMPVLEKACALR